jgi:hypothetical protein
MISGTFASSAFELAQHGLAVIPLGGPEGKVPLIKFAKMNRPPGPKFIAKMSYKFPDANVGILCGLSNLTVIDIDDPSLIGPMIDRCGDTQLKTTTPSGGAHLYYVSNGEACANLRESEGLDVDVKAIGGLIVAPPSVRLNGEHKGKSYEFLSGSWDDLPFLPELRQGSMPIGYCTPPQALQRACRGKRNDTLFRCLLREVRACDDFASFLDVARTMNDGYLPPLLDMEVVRTAGSVWKMEESGQNWVGQEPRFIITKSEMDSLLGNPDAYLLLGVLRLNHSLRKEAFAVSPKSMAKAKVIPRWGEKRYSKARIWLVENGWMDVVHEGGRHKGDVWLYRLSAQVPGVSR